MYLILNLKKKNKQITTDYEMRCSVFIRNVYVFSFKMPFIQNIYSFMLNRANKEISDDWKG